MRSATRCGGLVVSWHDAVAEPDVPGPLAGRAEEDFRRGRVRVFLEEVVLDLPRVVVAEPVGQLHLGQRVLVKLPLVVRPHGRGSCSS